MDAPYNAALLSKTAKRLWIDFGDIFGQAEPFHYGLLQTRSMFGAVNGRSEASIDGSKQAVLESTRVFA